MKYNQQILQEKRELNIDVSASAICLLQIPSHVFFMIGICNLIAVFSLNIEQLLLEKPNC
jgi:hypothetical protein